MILRISLPLAPRMWTVAPIKVQPASHPVPYAALLLAGVDLLSWQSGCTASFSGTDKSLEQHPFDCLCEPCVHSPAREFVCARHVCIHIPAQPNLRNMPSSRLMPLVHQEHCPPTEARVLVAARCSIQYGVQRWLADSVYHLMWYTCSSFSTAWQAIVTHSVLHVCCLTKDKPVDVK